MSDPCPTCNDSHHVLRPSPLVGELWGWQPCPDCGDIDHHGCPQPDTAPEGPTWPDGTVRLPGAIESWLDGHFEGEKDDDSDLLAMGRNCTAVALWSLIYRKGDPETDAEAIGALAAALNGAPATPAERAVIDAAVTWYVDQRTGDSMALAAHVAKLLAERNKTDG